MSTLYLVATPIGNLDDISARALQILKSVHLIAAEDTRQTQKLLKRYDIRTPVISYHEHSKEARLAWLVAALQKGDIALVSDAGTPALNDPGYELVRSALQAGHQVSPIPGACAPIAALTASGLPTDAFLYLGYLPRKSSERQRFLAQIVDLPYTLVFLEAPHRLVAALQDLLAVLGDRPAAVARELTKVHEEFVRGTLKELLAHFSEHAPRGEFTLVVAGKPPASGRWSEEEVRQAVRDRLDQSNGDKMSASSLADEIAALAGWRRRAVYRIILELQDTDRLAARRKSESGELGESHASR